MDVWLSQTIKIVIYKPMDVLKSGNVSMYKALLIRYALDSLWQLIVRTNDFFDFSLDRMWQTTEYLQSSPNTGRMNFMKTWRLLMYVHVQHKSGIVRTESIQGWVSVNTLDRPSIDMSWTHAMDIYINISFKTQSNSWLTSQSEVSWQYTCHQFDWCMWVSQYCQISQIHDWVVYRVSVKMSMACWWRVDQGQWSILEHRCI